MYPILAQSILGLQLDTIWSWGVRIAGVLLILVGAFLVAGWLKRVIVARLEKTAVERTLALLLGSVVRWGIIVLTVLGCLGMFGIETTSFAALIGGMGLAIGLAFQGSLSNVAAGAMLLVFRPYKVRDFIEVEGASGTVDEIGLFTTTLDTPDLRRITIPNGRIFGNVIENKSWHETRRVDINVGVSYDADIDETRRTLVEACRGLENTTADREPVAYLKELGDSSVNWQVRLFCSPDDYWAVREQGTRAIKYALDDAQIEIPYPHMVVETKAAQAVPKAAAE